MGVDVFDDQGYGDPRPRGIAIVPLDGGPPTILAIDDDRWTYDRVIKADERPSGSPDGTSVSLLLTERSTRGEAVVRYDPATVRAACCGRRARSFSTSRQAEITTSWWVSTRTC